MVVKDRNVLNTKFLAQFVNSLSDCGYDVHLVCDSYHKAGSGIQLADNVTFTNLSAKSKNIFKNGVTLLRSVLVPQPLRFQKQIDRIQPDIIICYFLIDLYNVCAAKKHHVPVIMMNHNYPPAIFKKLEKKSKKAQRTYTEIIENTDVIQVLNKNFEDCYRATYKTKRLVTIPNAVTQIPPDKRTDLSIEKKTIIYVARITKKGKQQHLLIEAFAKIADQFPDWELELWGSEKHKAYIQELQNLIHSHHLEENVFIKGFSHNIGDVYRSADIHAFASLQEGFGLGLADGMAMGLPSVGFDYAPSVNELIKEGENGFLAHDVDEFAQKLKQLMSDKYLRIKLGSNAAESMKQYTPETICEQWDRLIKETASRQKNRA